jgi:HSP20 family molecular chaperone IbpA
MLNREQGYLIFLENDKFHLDGYSVFVENGKVVLEVEIPGIPKEDLSVELLPNRQLKISTPKENRRRVNHTFSIRKDVDTEAISAELKDGILRVEMPLIKDKDPQKIEVH